MSAAEQVVKAVREASGLAISDSRDEMIELRLFPRLRALGADLEGYARAVAADERERVHAIELLATGHTAWWREAEHFDDLQQRVAPLLRARLDRGEPVRIWCAGCSTGEEAWSIALCVRLCLGDATGVAILATDISGRSIATARAGRYPAEQLAPLTPELRAVAASPAEDDPAAVEVRPELRRLVSFARHNLTGAWPMKGPFDVIFCRNVLVHLLPEARAQILGRMATLLRRPGTLYLGQAELLEPGIVPLRQLKPAIHVA
jgi:chemotaxis protein methyltransferase CheR